MGESAAPRTPARDSVVIVVGAGPLVQLATLQPEKRLMLALLEGAVSDFQTYATAVGGRGRRLFAEAQAWFVSRAADDPLDFESICEVLGLDPSFIRTGLQRWYLGRQREPSAARTMLRFPFRRVTGTRHRLTRRS
jgi:hypothetical protein